MRNVFVFVVLIVLAQNSVAQTLVSGTVRDLSGNPVSGATVALKDSYDGTTTDSLGKFSFATVEKGEQVVTVSSIAVFLTLRSAEGFLPGFSKELCSARVDILHYMDRHCRQRSFLNRWICLNEASVVCHYHL